MWVAQAAPRGERLHSGPPLTLYVEEHALPLTIPATSQQYRPQHQRERVHTCDHHQA